MIKITREEIENNLKIWEDEKNKISPYPNAAFQEKLYHLALAGFDAQWREVVTDPPPKEDVKLIEICDANLFWLSYAAWHDDLNSWVNQDLTKTKIYGTHWRYAVGPKVEGDE